MSKMLASMIELVLMMLSKEVLKKCVDAMLDIIEDTTAATENKIDDALILPLCARIRETFNVPDEDE
jgi:hypothetical protein